MTGSLPTTRGIGAAGWRYALRRALHGFPLHRGLDSAAALTFFSILLIFPATLVLVSAFALANGDTGRGVDRITDILGEFLTPDALRTARALLASFSELPDPGIALAIGLALGIWSMGSYATAFGRAIDAVYEVQEGRPLWRFRGTMTLVAIALLVLFSIAAAILLTTPTVAEAIGETLDIAPGWVLAFDIAKWPVLAALAVAIVGIIYFFTPNVRHARIRWVSWGAMGAIAAWGVATVLFGIYVLVVNSYDRVYGWLGGAIALIIWLYITNLVLVLGAELDAELVRVRQLTAGIEAEVAIRLPVRATARDDALVSRRDRDEREGRELRERSADEQPGKAVDA